MDDLPHSIDPHCKSEEEGPWGFQKSPSSLPSDFHLQQCQAYCMESSFHQEPSQSSAAASLSVCERACMCACVCACVCVCVRACVKFQGGTISFGNKIQMNQG